MKEITLEEQIAFVEKLRKRLEMSGEEQDNLTRQGLRTRDGEVLYKSENGKMYEAIKKSLRSLRSK